MNMNNELHEHVHAFKPEAEKGIKICLYLLILFLTLHVATLA